MRKVSRRLLLQIFVLGTVVVTFYLFKELTHSLAYECPDDKAKDILQDLCALYKNGLVAGNLCADLCHTGALQYVSCFNYHKGKAVFRASWDGKPVILKSKYGHLEEYPRPSATVVDKDGNMKTVVPDRELFRTMVFHQIQGQFGFDLKLSEEEVLRRMWTSNSKKSGEGDAVSDLDEVSLWALLQQEEYVFFQFWNDFHHYPRMYGTCGHFYALENVPPGFILNPQVTSMQQQLASLPWFNRAKIAMSLLELVAALDNAFPEKLHFCDIKHDNYGVTDEFTVKAIDVDIAFFQNQLDSTLKQPECVQDQECDFFDCKGSCNITSGKCNKERTNTNLQGVCADIFTRHYGTPGLLRLPPTQIAHQLDSALQDCLDQKGLPDNVKISQMAVYQRLFELLEASLKYVEK